MSILKIILGFVLGFAIGKIIVLLLRRKPTEMTKKYTIMARVKEKSEMRKIHGEFVSSNVYRTDTQALNALSRIMVSGLFPIGDNTFISLGEITEVRLVEEDV